MPAQAPLRSAAEPSDQPPPAPPAQAGCAQPALAGLETGAIANWRLPPSKGPQGDGSTPPPHALLDSITQPCPEQTRACRSAALSARAAAVGVRHTTPPPASAPGPLNPRGAPCHALAAMSAAAQQASTSPRAAAAGAGASSRRHIESGCAAGSLVTARAGTHSGTCSSAPRGRCSHCLSRPDGLRRWGMP